MNTYYLVQNLMYDCKHVIKRRWYHRVIGQPKLTVDIVEAVNPAVARKKFKLMGHHFGMFH